MIGKEKKHPKKNTEINKIINSAINIDNLKSLSKSELIKIILSNQEMTVPLTIFNTKLAPLESLSKYLIEKKEITIKETSKLLNRHFKTIWTTYNNVKKTTIFYEDTQIHIPVSVFSKEKLSILESLIIFLKNKGMKFSEISNLIHRDERTIWTCHNRAKNKLGGKHV